MRILSVIKDIDFIKPIGLMQISAIAKQLKHETELAVLSKEDIFTKIDIFHPDMIMYSATTGEHKFYSSINKKIKERHNNIFTIMGGPHATFFPEVLKEAELDAICIGEGEDAFTELLNNIEENRNISKLDNIATRGTTSSVRPLIADLDKLPFPDRKLFYRGHKKDLLPIMNFITSRGCPHDCSYCFNHIYKRYYSNWGSVRYHSVRYVIEEILAAQEDFNFKYIRFNDDDFLLKPLEWIEEFAELYSQKIHVPFYIHSRYEMAAKRRRCLKLLKKAGLTTIQMSIESPNERMRKEILKRNMKDETILEGAKIVLEEGLSVLSYTMLGLPDSKIDDDINAIDFNLKAKIPAAEFPIFNPFPGTELAKICVEKGYFNNDPHKFSMYADNKASLLNCFTEKEKAVQININLLGPLVIQHRFLRGIIGFLIYLPPNMVFRTISIVNKMFSYPNHVYKRKYSLSEKVEMLIKGFKMEFKRRRFDKMRDEGTKI